MAKKFSIGELSRLEAGISYGKKYKLTPGITLSEEQMKAITTDMVWLETKTVVVNGQL